MAKLPLQVPCPAWQRPCPQAQGPRYREPEANPMPPSPWPPCPGPPCGQWVRPPCRVLCHSRDSIPRLLPWKPHGPPWGSGLSHFRCHSAQPPFKQNLRTSFSSPSNIIDFIHNLSTESGPEPSPAPERLPTSLPPGGSRWRPDQLRSHWGEGPKAWAQDRSPRRSPRTATAEARGWGGRLTWISWL